MKKSLQAAVAALFLAAVAGCSQLEAESAGQEEVRILFATPIAETHPAHQSLLKFQEDIEKNSGGRMVVDLYPGGVLGGDREVTESVQRGEVNMTITSTSPVANFELSMYVYDLPFLFPDKETAYEILDGDLGSEIFDRLEDQNLKGLVYFENGFRHLTTSSRPITSVNDFKGLKLRAIENRVHLNTWQSLDANPTPMAFGEIFTGLQQGTIDGQENPIPLITANKFQDVQNYLTLSGHMYTPFIVIMNLEFYESLPPDLRAILEETLADARDHQRNQMAKAEEEGLKEIEESGTEILEISDKEKERMIELVSPVYEQTAEWMDEDLLRRFIEASRK